MLKQAISSYFKPFHDILDPHFILFHLISPISFSVSGFAHLLVLRRQVLKGIEHQLRVPLRHAEQASLRERVRALG